MILDFFKVAFSPCLIAGIFLVLSGTQITQQPFFVWAISYNSYFYYPGQLKHFIKGQKKRKIIKLEMEVDLINDWKHKYRRKWSHLLPFSVEEVSLSLILVLSFTAAALTAQLCHWGAGNRVTLCLGKMAATTAADGVVLKPVERAERSVLDSVLKLRVPEIFPWTSLVL